MSFKASEHLQDEGLPAGDFRMKIEEATNGFTNLKGDPMVKFKIRVLGDTNGGEYCKNALQWENLVVEHESEMVQKIAKQKLAELCIACGIAELKPLEEGGYDLSPFVDMEINGRSLRSKNGRPYVIYRKPDNDQMGENPLQAVAEPSANTSSPVVNTTAPIDGDFDDDIPF